MNLSFFVKLLALSLLGLIVVIVIDPLDKSTVSTPFLLGLVLMALSLRRSVQLVVSASLMYSIFAVYALTRFMDYQSVSYPVPHPYFWLFQRGGLFLVLCALAIYLAHYRTNTGRILVHVQEILAKLPAPVLISDATGYITYANDALGKLFKKQASELTGKRYVEYIMSDIQEGKAMRYYIEIFGDETNGVHELEIQPLNNSKMKARLTCLGSGPNRVLITAFDLLQVPAPKNSVVPPNHVQPANL